MLLTSVLMGFAVYGSRMSLIYLGVFFLPWHWLLIALRILRNPQNRVARILINTGFFILGLFVFLELFGRDLSKWGGREVRMDAGPNLPIAFLFWAWPLWQGLRKYVRS